MRQRQAHAAHLERFGALRQAASTQNHLGRAATNVDHQAGQFAGLQAGHTLSRSRGFFVPQSYFQWVPQGAIGSCRNASRLRASRRVCVATARTCHEAKAFQALGEASQANQPSLRRLFGQQAVFIQTCTQAHGFL